MSPRPGPSPPMNVFRFRSLFATDEVAGIYNIFTAISLIVAGTGPSDFFPA